MAITSNLPVELTSFVGREAQLSDLRRLLRRSRLITLTGPGGVGKSRLALRLASGVRDRYPGGRWLVELTAITDPRLIERTVAAACGVRESAAVPVIESLLEHLNASANTLLLLDGAEHVVAAVGKFAGRVLRGAPGLTVLVTSREPLGINGEVIWRTPSLGLPATRDPHPTLSQRERGRRESEAVRLFIDRARAARPGFAPPASASEVGELCVRLDGLPLAIELAASLVTAMTVQEIRVALSEKLRLRETLEQTIDWSHELLSPDERELFARLSVLTGGFDLAAAKSIGSLDGEDVLPVLVHLVNKSLVVAEDRMSETTRYRMLDTIRDYAAAKLGPAGGDGARRRHAEHFFAFAQEGAAQMRSGEQGVWLARIEEEMPNLRAALEWFERESPDTMMAMAGHLSRYWYVRARLSEGLEWLDRSLATRGVDPAARLPALQTRARLRRHRGDLAGAESDVKELVATSRRLGLDKHTMGGLVTLGTINASLSRWSEARRYFTSALAIQRELKDPGLIAGGLNNLALIQSEQGQNRAALQRIGEALEMAEQTSDRILKATILETAARIERRSGETEAARRHYHEALDLAVEFEDVLTSADVLDGLGLMALADGDPTRALVMIAASTKQRATMQLDPPHSGRVEVDDGVATARARLRPQAAAAAWQRGEAMTLASAVEFVRGQSNGHAPVSELTDREMEVARLIAEGLTNSDIAGLLKISERTADAHVEHIRNKLGLRHRTQIAVWAHAKV